MLVDSTIVILYLLLTLAVGLYYSKDISTSKDFSTFSFKDANYSNIILVSTMFATAIGGGSTFGSAAKTFEGKHTYAIAYFISLIIYIIFVPKLVMRLQRFYRVDSPGDIMHHFYGRPGQFITGVSAALVSIGYVAGQISAAGYIFEYFLDVPHLYGIIISYGIVTIYTASGGLRSVIYTDLLQYCTMIGGIPTIIIFALSRCGPIETFTSKIPEHFYIHPDRNFYITIALMVLSYCTMVLYPSFVQRLTLNSNFRQTSHAVVRTYSWMGLYKIIVIIIGLCAAILYPDIKSSLVVPHMVNEIAPVGFKGLIIAALIAAVMSTADSNLNVAAITLSKNVIKPIFNIQNDKTLLNLMRYSTIAIGTLSIYIANQFSNIIDLIIFVSGFWAPVFLVPFVAGVYDIIISQRGYVLSCLSGTISFFICESYLSKMVDFQLDGVSFGTIISGIVFFLFYKFEKNPKIYIPTKSVTD